MTISYVLGENPFLYVPTTTGLPNAMGFFRFSDTVTGAPKPVYLDQSNLNPAPNPYRLTQAGITEAPIYFQIDSTGNLYTLEILDSNGTVFHTIPNYPTAAAGGGGDVTLYQNLENYGRNEQFTFWSNSTNFTNADLPIGTTEIADDWFYDRLTTNATLSIQRYTFNAGANLVPNSPPYALLYTVTSGGADLNGNFIYQKYDNVQTFNNQTITASIYAYALNAGGASVLTLYVIQDFGTGGSAEVKTVVNTFVTDDSPTQYSATFVVPSIGGKTIGTGSFVRIVWQLDSTLTQQTVLANYALQDGNGTGLNYPYVTINQQFVKILPDELAGHAPTQGTSLIGMSVSEAVNPVVSTETLQQYLNLQAQYGSQQSALIGWDFITNPRQFGTTFTAVNSGTYIADQTILLSDGNGVITSSSAIGSPLNLSMVIANKKFGIFQIIEDLNCVNLQQYLTSLSAVITTSTTPHTFKMAILSSATSSATAPRAAVSSWNVAGTNPSLTAPWVYASSVADFVPDDSTLNFNVLNAQSLAPATCYGVLIWCDSADMGVGDYANFWNASLVRNQTASMAPNEDVDTVLSRCRRYVYRTYGVGVANGFVTQTESYSFPLFSYTGTLGLVPISYPFTGPVSASTNSTVCPVLLPVEMYAIPTATIYNSYTGAANGAYVSFINATAAISAGSHNITATLLGAGRNTLSIGVGAGSMSFPAGTTLPYAPSAYFDFVATSLLGV